MHIFLRIGKVKAYNPHVLTLFIWLVSLVGIVFWLYLLYYMVFVFKMPADAKYPLLSWCGNISRRLAFLTISASSLHILIKAQHTRATLYFSLFFSFLSFVVSIHWLIFNKIFSEELNGMLDILSGISIILLVRFIQEFPGRLSRQDIKDVYTGYVPHKLLAPIFVWLLKAYRVWLILLPLVILIPQGSMFGKMIVIVCAGLSLGYLYVQLRVSESALKNRLYWLLWLLFLIVVSSLFSIALRFYYQEGFPVAIEYGITLLANLSILFAFIMPVYFSDLIDAKLILQKTVLWGGILFLFTFIFGAAEHFIIHQLSHYWHINDVYVASMFACVMGMCFHPLKEKLTHWMKQFEKVEKQTSFKP